MTRSWLLPLAFGWLLAVAVLTYFGGNVHYSALAIVGLVLIGYAAPRSVAFVTAIASAALLPWLDKVVPPSFVVSSRFDSLVLAVAFCGVVYVTDQLRRRTLEAAELRERAVRAETAARIDQLTGIPNRAHFLARLRDAIHDAREGERIGVLFADLDGFKDVNDENGHVLGDRVLELASRRLGHGLRASDVLARVGGDEFAAVVRNVQSRAEARRMCDALEASFAEPFRVDGIIAAIGVTVGASIYPDEGMDAQTLIAAADRAMYARKRAKRTARITRGDTGHRLAEQRD